MCFVICVLGVSSLTPILATTQALAKGRRIRVPGWGGREREKRGEFVVFTGWSWEAAAPPPKPLGRKRAVGWCRRRGQSGRTARRRWPVVMPRHRRWRRRRCEDSSPPPIEEKDRRKRGKDRGKGPVGARESLAGGWRFPASQQSRSSGVGGGVKEASGSSALKGFVRWRGGKRKRVRVLWTSYESKRNPTV